MRARVVLLLLAAVFVPWPPARADADDPIWALLKGGGQVVMIRHGKTDGSTGDPPGFKLDDCATQRNLIEQGREDARRIGATRLFALTYEEAFFRALGFARIDRETLPEKVWRECITCPKAEQETWVAPSIRRARVASSEASAPP